MQSCTSLWNGSIWSSDTRVLKDTNRQLDRLGGLGWQKTKAKAKRAMRDMADELLRLYAERKLVGGYAFAVDTPWQQEFEDGFQFVLTPDQETAIEDVKT